MEIYSRKSRSNIRSVKSGEGMMNVSVKYFKEPPIGIEPMTY